MIFDQSFIISWNNEFPLDKWYRDKYIIPFNSKKHRNVSYIDMFLEYYEGELFKKSIERTIDEDKNKEEYKRTKKWFVPTISEEERVRIEQREKKMIDMFDNLDITAFTTNKDE